MILEKSVYEQTRARAAQHTTDTQSLLVRLGWKRFDYYLRSNSSVFVAVCFGYALDGTNVSRAFFLADDTTLHGSRLTRFIAGMRVFAILGRDEVHELLQFNVRVWGFVEQPAQIMVLIQPKKIR